MAWIKCESHLWTKPEVMRLADIENCSTDEVVGRLLRVWSWFDVNSTTGKSDITIDALGRAICAEKFVKSMQTVGWLNVDENGYVSMPNFRRHNGKSAKQRALSQKRSSRYRHARVTLASRSSAPTSPNIEERRGEEIREEEIIHTPPLPPKGEGGGGGDLGECPFDGNGKPEDPIAQLGTDLVRLAEDWQGVGRVSSLLWGHLVEAKREYGEGTLATGIQICIENDKKRWSYLASVLKNGAQRKGSKSTEPPQPQTIDDVIAMFPADRQAEVRAQMEREELERQSAEVF